MLGALEFENGVYASLVVCSEAFSPEVPRVDIYGTEGHLSLPDPNYFGGWGNDVVILQKAVTEPKALRFLSSWIQRYRSQHYAKER